MQSESELDQLVEKSKQITLPEEIWLAGKGPSLDKYDWSKAGDVRIGINEAALVIPNCWGAIALDKEVLKKYKKDLPNDVVVFRKYNYHDYVFSNMYLWNYRDHAPIRTATAPVIIQICHHLGARKIHFVGFDAVTKQESTFADSIKKIHGEGKNTSGYKQITLGILAVIQKLDIEAVWEHL